MVNFFTLKRMWALTLGLLAFDALLVYLFINQPTVLSLQSQWDFRHHDLRRIEVQQQAQVESLLPTPTPVTVESFVKHPQSSSPAELKRFQIPTDSRGQVL